MSVPLMYHVDVWNWTWSHWKGCQFRLVLSGRCSSYTRISVALRRLAGVGREVDPCSCSFDRSSGFGGGVRICGKTLCGRCFLDECCFP